MKSGGRYKLRKRVNVSIFQQYHVNEDDLNGPDFQHDQYLHAKSRSRRKRKNRREQMQRDYEMEMSHHMDQSSIFDKQMIIDRLPENKLELEKMQRVIKERIQHYKEKFLTQEQQNRLKISHVGENSIPICADVTTYDWQKLIDQQKKIGNRMFDVIMMDPPWKLSTSQPSRGVAIQYQSLNDEQIQRIPIQKLQKSGLIFIWTINAKLAVTLNLMKKWDYQVVDSIAWTKSTVNMKIAKGHGFYLQHAKETCIIGVKGKNFPYQPGVASDLIFSQRRGQSQKPAQIYDYIQKLVPNGFYIQIFGRRNNLRNGWVTIGNQI